MEEDATKRDVFILIERDDQPNDSGRMSRRRHTGDGTASGASDCRRRCLSRFAAATPDPVAPFFKTVLASGAGARGGGGARLSHLFLRPPNHLASQTMPQCSTAKPLQLDPRSCHGFAFPMFTSYQYGLDARRDALNAVRQFTAPRPMQCAPRCSPKRILRTSSVVTVYYTPIANDSHPPMYYSTAVLSLAVCTERTKPAPSIAYIFPPNFEFASEDNGRI
ncbi:hypothetical protein B0H16DRAFT_1722752 [Mycena metata]|uniref:Uncharacterized protein n=1 Tax=Mycena metata TaxID=1033252 RepID=A0AAD7J2R8_9AGAR|nr:hypothetical protein B0H16DRAFT_1722752 [Mycena metata]